MNSRIDVGAIGAEVGHAPSRWRRSLAARAFSDASAVVMAGAVLVGAWLAVPGVTVIGVVAAVVAFCARRPWLLIVGLALASSGSAARATAGLVMEPGSWSGPVEVLRVATTSRGQVHAEVRDGHRHLDLFPTSTTEALVAGAAPGDRLEVTGRVVPLDAETMRGRGSHVAGRLHAARVGPGGPPRPAWRLAGAVRRAVAGLGRPLPASQRALYEGFVLGDASGQTAVQRADFRASGLTHLLVASGENVAFVLLLAAPVSSRVGFRTRWILTLGVCGMYALVTGLEPSVLRASVMAAVAVSATSLGHPVRSWRSLAYAVTGLVLADPFLVHSAAFGLSVGASAGILALARPIAAAAGGPSWLRLPLAVTVAAQIGVAPILLAFPGGMPVAALPANLAAAFPAGLVMVAGLPALAIAATPIPGSGIAVVVPRLLLGWVDAVARHTAAWSLGYLDAATTVVVVLGVTIVLVAHRDRSTRLRRVGWVVAGAGLLVPLVFGATGGVAVDGTSGPVVVRRGGTVVVVFTGTVPDEVVLTDLSIAGVRGIDLVVVPHGDEADRRMLTAIAHRHRIDRVLTPVDLPGRRWRRVVGAGGDVITVGDAVVDVVATSPVLTVHVRRDDAGVVGG